MKKLAYLGCGLALTFAGILSGARPAAATDWVCTTTCDGPSCCTTCCSNGIRVICTENPCHVTD
jgi:molybdopterin-guanine dinucleotide biosynthesis protein A